MKKELSKQQKTEDPPPFAALPEGEVLLQRIAEVDEPKAVGEMVRNILWFFDKMELKINKKSPLERALFHPELLPSDSRYRRHLYLQVRHLDWAIRALYSEHANRERKVECEIDRTFLTRELLQADTKQKGSVLKLAGGVGTLRFAGRLVQAGGGGRIRINGTKGARHDIRWRSPQGYLVLVERRDRSFEDGLKDTIHERVRKVIKDMRKAGTEIPREDDAARILMVSFQQGASRDWTKVKEEVGDHYWAAVEAKFGTDPNPALPDSVIVEHLDVPSSKTAEMHPSYVLMNLNPWKPEFARVRPVIRKAIEPPNQSPMPPVPNA